MLAAEQAVWQARKILVHIRYYLCKLHTHSICRNSMWGSCELHMLSAGLLLGMGRAAPAAYDAYSVLLRCSQAHSLDCCCEAACIQH